MNMEHDEKRNARKKLKKKFEEVYELDEDSDIPVHERYVKEEPVRK